MHVGEYQADATPAQGVKEVVLHKPGFTDEQWQTFIKLMENCKATSSGEKLSGMKLNDEWLLDSGASYHMIGNCNALKGMVQIAPVAVVLPNGEHTKATHDLPTRMPIGVGERRGGVYFFRGLDQAQAYAVRSSDSGVLWHSRLGHPSIKVLRLLGYLNKPLLHFDQNNVCDVCMRGKQTRDSFVVSSTRAVEPFELIHCDIWGPYRKMSTCGAHYFL
ncbi:unnamed protein product, partial [Cuscuta europaea]